MKESIYETISDLDTLPNKKRYFGIYRGFCEYSLDPLELGRFGGGITTVKKVKGVGTFGRRFGTEESGLNKLRPGENQENQKANEFLLPK